MAMRCVKQGYGPQSGEFRQCYEAEYKREVALRVRAKQREDIQLANPAPVSPRVTCRTTSYSFVNPCDALQLDRRSLTTTSEEHWKLAAAEDSRRPVFRAAFTSEHRSLLQRSDELASHLKLGHGF